MSIIFLLLVLSILGGYNSGGGAYDKIIFLVLLDLDIIAYNSIRKNLRIRAWIKEWIDGEENRTSKINEMMKAL